jgi:hypothetical protein
MLKPNLVAVPIMGDLRSSENLWRIVPLMVSEFLWRQALRESISVAAAGILNVNNLNYMNPSSQRVADYLLSPDLQACLESYHPHFKGCGPSAFV